MWRGISDVGLGVRAGKLPSPIKARTISSELPQHSLPLPLGTLHKPFGALSYADLIYTYFILHPFIMVLESEFVSQLCHLLAVRPWRSHLTSLSPFL